MSRLSLYLTIYLSLCLAANLCLMVLFLVDFKWTTSPASSHSPQSFSNAIATRITHVSEGGNTSNGKFLSCSDLHSITNLSAIGAGWTKAVYRGLYQDTWVAVKTVHTLGHDMTECTDEVNVCYRRSALKIVKEIQLLRELAHSNVVKVLGECIPGVDYSPGPPVVGVVVMVTELGRPVDMIEVLQMNFEDRLRLAYDMARILLHLVTSPLGMLLMKDFRRQQFVLVESTLKLSDVDDLDIGDPECTSDHDCIRKDDGTDNVIVSLTCEMGICIGYNSLLNAVFAGRHFMRLLIPYGSPRALEPAGTRLVDQLLSGRLDSVATYSQVKHLVDEFSTGAYLSDAEKDYIKRFEVEPSSTVSEGNFSCLGTRGPGCVQSVSSPAEAAWICLQYSECMAFVVTDDITWTGRRITIFKTAADRAQKKANHTLYVRRGQG